jgi:23S rRNA (guanine745-N1)-methyltransferase
MVAAREAFLAAGHLDPVSAALADHAGTNAEGVVADVGAGTGHHLAHVLDRHRARTGIALDSSAPALRRAARAHPRMAAIACDAWSQLPLKDGSAAVVLSVFAPRGAPEIRRVLARDGVVVAVTPTERHLHELREPLGMLEVQPGKAARLADDLGLAERERGTIERTLTLTAHEAELAARMGPAGFHERETQELPETLLATLSVDVTVLSFAP